MPPTTQRIFWLLPLLVAACAGGRMDRFDQVRSGMSRDQVHELLGNPSSRSQREVDASGKVLRLERWQYGDSLSTLATGAVFSDLPDRRVWAVMFDDDGLVLMTQEPDWSEEPSPLSPPSVIPSPNQ